jgi:hypothetical protein
MPNAEYAPAETAVEAAITRVLSAERDAREAVAQATRDAAAMSENARGAARALAERTERRIGTVRAAFEAVVAADVAAIDADATAQDASQPLSADDLHRLERAIAALAAELTATLP